MAIDLASGGILLNIIAIAVVVGFVFTLMLPKKIHYTINGVILIILGCTHILYEFYFTNIDIRGSPIVRFVIAFVVGATSKELIKESMHEKGKGMKAAALIMGLILIGLIIIPELYHAEAISFSLPEFPLMFSFFYIIGGVIAIIATFTKDE